MRGAITNRPARRTNGRLGGDRSQSSRRDSSTNSRLGGEVCANGLVYAASLFGMNLSRRCTDVARDGVKMRVIEAPVFHT
jgi:hypothetical protein